MRYIAELQLCGSICVYRRGSDFSNLLVVLKKMQCIGTLLHGSAEHIEQIHRECHGIVDHTLRRHAKRIYYHILPYHGGGKCINIIKHAHACLKSEVIVPCLQTRQGKVVPLQLIAFLVGPLESVERLALRSHTLYYTAKLGPRLTVR